MQKLGQHFLKNTAVLEKIVAALALADNDCVIEIGPGHGELTAPLVLAARARGGNGEIFCIEKDHALIRDMEAFAAKENLSGSHPLLTIIEGDALKLLPETIARFSARDDRIEEHVPSYKIVGNIPYYITGKLLRVVSELDHKPERVALLIQEEVAERICAAPPEMNRLAASVQFWADAEIIARVPRKDFSPPPEVDSAVILLKTKVVEQVSGAQATNDIDPALYYRAVRGIFAQPRKTLLNNLSVMAADGIAKGDIVKRLEKIGVSSGARPQDLAIGQIIAIAKAPLWG